MRIQLNRCELMSPMNVAICILSMAQTVVCDTSFLSRSLQASAETPLNDVCANVSCVDYLSNMSSSHIQECCKSQVYDAAEKMKLRKEEMEHSLCGRLPEDLQKYVCEDSTFAWWIWLVLVVVLVCLCSCFVKLFFRCCCRCFRK
eukprot:TRINITY_DN1659_c0_g1_i2.p1 TRINITY_DN1659_c0_g1~~TRINITY_DN1659_c0_g1_i2.p1  ORF type:complete len:145 (-),score=11.79 TRINITY_DN1659_c0_g1_i2:126-560(-)